MTCCNFPLPEVLLSVSGDALEARSPRGDPPTWRIYAEAETETAARTRVSLDGRVLADVTIHAAHKSQLPDEVQAVAAALLWSALRATAEPWTGISPAHSGESEAVKVRVHRNGCDYVIGGECRCGRDDPDTPPCDRCDKPWPCPAHGGVER